MTDSRSKGLWFDSWRYVEVSRVFSVSNAESDETCVSLHIISIADGVMCSEGWLRVESGVFLFHVVPVQPVVLATSGLKRCMVMIILTMKRMFTIVLTLHELIKDSERF